ncbi:hypothetical protein C8A01DRAFT_47801 [Parachaetomium inaequale]|uniref:Uncharacterized protein n=1 Tax=Parachaetomium inaequale TaxID=2588326 RepID=A0AAN6SQP1_9PEZI|nr:hypothetical protein C8A01DRAFT_47801 [Parachaetomium inaequale]
MESPSTPQVALDADSLAQLNNTDARSLLDTVDSLRDLGVGDLVNLPQIIVVGDQSSGKSSVLEALSRVRFPIEDDLCTRFATELVLRQANDTTVNVSIQFADADPAADQRDAARHPFQRSSFDKDALPGIIAEAKELMGIRRGGAKRFSKDILRVEIAGPDIYPLTLVDLPGIFHSATDDQDLQDKETVSIILAVVAANNQLALQTVLQEAKKHDRKSERTIGIITKPDLAGRGSANEKKYLDLARGRESMHKLALGWYVLRNRSEEERSSEAEVRDTVEERFFRAGEWSAISPANRGVESLRKRLSKVLLNHIRKNLPGLISEIEHNLETRQKELARLGKSRSSPEELRSYLIDIIEKFQRLARDAIEGRYNDEFFGTLDQSEETAPRKLRAVLRSMNCAFGAVMETKGAAYKIERDEDEDDEDDDAEDDSDGDGQDEYVQQFIDQYDVFPYPESRTEYGLNGDLQSMASYNRGKELPGDTNPDLVFLLFKKQVAPWESIAQQHLDHVLGAAQAFVNSVFLNRDVVVDDATSAAILSECVDPFFAKKKQVLQEKLQELLLPYTSGYGPPLDGEFGTKMYQRTSQRVAARFATRLEEQYPEMFQPNRGGLTRRNIMNAISLRTFVNNVINLTVESCLVRHIPTILTSRDVLGMDTDKLEELASEPEDVQKQRMDLQHEIEVLRKGLRKFQKHKLRDVAGPFFMILWHMPLTNPESLARASFKSTVSLSDRSSSANDGQDNGDYNDPNDADDYNDASYHDSNDDDGNFGAQYPVPLGIARYGHDLLTTVR